ncbi:MAG: hypothetical protein WD801_12135 [Gemmatimonadaceae bacterium]
MVSIVSGVGSLSVYTLYLGTRSSGTTGFPRVPGYLAFISGTSISESNGRPNAAMGHVSIRAFAFVLGFAAAATA